MAFLLDVIGSFAIGASVLLLIVRFNHSMLDSSNEFLAYNLTQKKAAQVSQILEYDFYKIGFRITGEEKISIAEKSRIQYYSDYDNDGITDTVEYFLSDTAALAVTDNPKDKLLYRTINDGDEYIIGPVVLFELTYNDSRSTEITPVSKLADPAERIKIREIDIHIYVETEFPVSGIYQGTECRKNLLLKNVY